MSPEVAARAWSSHRLLRAVQLIDVSVTGTVRSGVEHGVLLLDDAAGRTWQLVGPPVRALRPGQRVRVTGQSDDRGMAGSAQQGHRFLVVAVTVEDEPPG